MEPRSVYEYHKAGNVVYLTFPFITGNSGVKAIFSTRLGGLSSPPYDSLNLGIHVGDDAYNVLVNRRRLCDAVGVKYSKLVCASQVHGCQVKVVNPKQTGRGVQFASDAIPDCDGLVTASPDVPLALFFADCVPIYFFDPVNRVIALAHAGWRGTFQRIGLKTIEVMARQFGSVPEQVLVVIGPAIGSCCYEIGNDVADSFTREFPDCSGFLRAITSGKWRLDLKEANRQVLQEAGLKDEHIAVSDLCTSCQQNLFFSYRASGGKTGRMAAVMMLEKCNN
ncbi:MAG: peptidoglycan editing factor PgeF [Peptococcaceae bacterium]|nr:peptidoglycan editing factor PgeF [Peptococcaceae bacterium]